jgi:CheY-like chemotaxis protein
LLSAFPEKDLNCCHRIKNASAIPSRTDKELMAQPSYRILVVEDDRALGGLMAKVLRHWGYGVECASSPGEALAVFKTHACDMVLLDLLMPGTTGQELAPHLKHYKPSVPVVLISAFPPDKIPNVDRTYSKPINLGKLRQIVETALGQRLEPPSGQDLSARQSTAPDAV